MNQENEGFSKISDAQEHNIRSIDGYALQGFDTNNIEEPYCQNIIKQHFDVPNCELQHGSNTSFEAIYYTNVPKSYEHRDELHNFLEVRTITEVSTIFEIKDDKYFPVLVPENAENIIDKVENRRISIVEQFIKNQMQEKKDQEEEEHRKKKRDSRLRRQKTEVVVIEEEEEEEGKCSDDENDEDYASGADSEQSEESGNSEGVVEIEEVETEKNEKDHDNVSACTVEYTGENDDDDDDGDAKSDGKSSVSSKSKKIQKMSRQQQEQDKVVKRLKAKQGSEENVDVSSSTQVT